MYQASTSQKEESFISEKLELFTLVENLADYDNEENADKRARLFELLEKFEDDNSIIIADRELEGEVELLVEKQENQITAPEQKYRYRAGGGFVSVDIFKFAACLGHVRVFEEIINWGEERGKVNQCDFVTLLFDAVSQDSGVEIVKLLLSRLNSDIQLDAIKDKYGENVMHRAVSEGNIEAIDALHEFGMKLEIRSSQGLCPLHFAQNFATIRHLRNLGVNLDSRVGNGKLGVRYSTGETVHNILDIITRRFLMSHEMRTEKKEDLFQSAVFLIESGCEVNIEPNLMRRLRAMQSIDSTLLSKLYKDCQNFSKHIKTFEGKYLAQTIDDVGLRAATSMCEENEDIRKKFAQDLQPFFEFAQQQNFNEVESFAFLKTALCTLLLRSVGIPTKETQKATYFLLYKSFAKEAEDTTPTFLYRSVEKLNLLGIKMRSFIDSQTENPTVENCAIKVKKLKPVHYTKVESFLENIKKEFTPSTSLRAASSSLAASSAMHANSQTL